MDGVQSTRVGSVLTSQSNALYNPNEAILPTLEVCRADQLGFVHKALFGNFNFQN